MHGVRIHYLCAIYFHDGLVALNDNVGRKWLSVSVSALRTCSDCLRLLVAIVFAVGGQCLWTDNLFRLNIRRNSCVLVGLTPRARLELPPFADATTAIDRRLEVCSNPLERDLAAAVTTSPSVELLPWTSNTTRKGRVLLPAGTGLAFL